MHTYDCFTFFNELDLLEIRLNELSAVVDTFVIVEAPLTFQGKPKPLYFEENRARFSKFDKKIRHVVVNDMPTTNNPWDREHHQRNALKRGMYDATPDAIVIISDADEIPKPAAILEMKKRQNFAYLQMKYFVYFLNYELVEGELLPLIKTYSAPWRQIQNISNLTSPRDGIDPQDYLRSQHMGGLSEHLIRDGGWHFSWLGTADRMIQKMDAFSHTEERFKRWHNPEYLARSIAQKRFFMENCKLEARSLEDMPATVKDASAHYREIGMLAPDLPAKEAHSDEGFWQVPEITAVDYRSQQKSRQSKCCIVCTNVSLKSSVTKFDANYLVCESCGVIFMDGVSSMKTILPDDTSGIQATLEFQKNRLQRLTEHLGRKPDAILDFGCGHGYYIDFLKNSGCHAIGINQKNLAQLFQIAPGSLDAINMVEIIAHLGNPLKIFEQLRTLLKPDGILYIEGSFVDFIGDPGQSRYIDPRIGNWCIHSRRSIEYIAKKLVMDIRWINNNVVVMRKNDNVARLTPFLKVLG